MAKEADSILEVFMANAMQQPDKLCLEFEGRQTSYGELSNLVSGFGAGLRQWGLKPEDRVALFMENCPEFVAAYLGTHLAGGVVVLVNTQYKQVELRHILSDAGVRLCFTDKVKSAEIERVRENLPDLEKVVIIDESESLQLFLEIKTNYQFDWPKDGDELAIIAYTSGTTGRSKGAMLTHRNLICNALAVCEAWQWTENDHLLLTLPLFHAHGLMVGLHGTLVKGASASLRRHFQASEVYAELLSSKPTMFFGVPTMYSRLLAEAAKNAERPQPLRLYVSGSAPLSPQTFAEFQQIFGQAILERYGMTETIMNLTNPFEGERRPGTVGKPFPGQEARVVDVQTRQPLPAGGVGEIEVRGPHVFKGYWNRPDATAEVFDPDGWFRTGDLGSLSEDGYYTISGRAKELIISGGYNVYPREVEEVLESYPGVLEVAVVGLPDADLGEQVVAVVVVRHSPTITAEQLVALCRENLASYKKPRQVYFVESLPRNALGKIQKHLVREQLLSQEKTV